MGVPALFRWLSNKYPKIVSPVVEEQPGTIEGVEVPVDITGPNPNEEEFDNLYLDMNGIVHPCSHPEDRPPPANEEEMMKEIFKYTDRVVNMVRPRKLLMIAVDGVAPRAKMNQQRSRRFRAAQEAKEKDADNVEFLKMLKAQKGSAGSEDAADMVIKKTWDSNSITPGTPFMDILAASLRYWIAYKLNTDPGWAKIKVIISDSTVPGEGEHKIMQFIRSQRSSPEHDPNTRHVMYGLDADLIMLGLATHEPHFRVLREDVFFQESKARTCRICGQKGHEARECRGQAKERVGDHDELEKHVGKKPFIWLHVSVLREYLEAELYVPDQPFRFDLERAIDDWVFMCFFVGNDFLPHLPSLEIRENGIDTLIAIWRDNIPYMGGYLTKDGHVDLSRAQLILEGLAKQESAIFRRRRQTEERREANAKRRKMQDAARNGGAQNPTMKNPLGTRVDTGTPTGLPMFAPGNISKEAREITHDMVVNRGSTFKADVANKSAAAVLKSRLLASQNKTGSEESATSKEDSNEAAADASDAVPSLHGKRKAELMEGGSETPGNDSTKSGTPGTPNEGNDEMPPDTVRLWEEGYADRYYEQKFKVDPNDIEFRHKVARAYVEGLAWVLLYYFQGCPSWDWYYPYHYAPFAADFVNLGDMTIKFEKGTIFKPFEQLMSVLPAASRHAIPEVFHDLMTKEDSTIIDFYPVDFPIDLNGKKFAWQGVAILPFIDAKRLLEAMRELYPQLSAEDAARNVLGRDVLLVSEAHHALYDDIVQRFYSKRQGDPTFELDPKISEGLAGQVEKDETYFPHGTLTGPLAGTSLPGLDDDRSLTVFYQMPKLKHLHKSMLLRGAKLGAPALTRSELEVVRSKAAQTGRSYGGAPLSSNYGGRGPGSFNYAPSSNNGQSWRGRQPQYSSNQGSYGHNPQSRPQPYNTWQPPAPGTAAFAHGPPPPPPPGGHYPPQVQPSWGQQGSYQEQRSGPPPPMGRYGGPQNNGSYQQNGYGSNDRGYGNGSGGSGGNGYRGYQGDRNRRY